MEKVLLLNKLFGVFLVLIKWFPPISNAHSDGDTDRIDTTQSLHVKNKNFDGSDAAQLLYRFCDKLPFRGTVLGLSPKR